MPSFGPVPPDDLVFIAVLARELKLEVSYLFRLCREHAIEIFNNRSHDATRGTKGQRAKRREVGAASERDLLTAIEQGPCVLELPPWIVPEASFRFRFRPSYSAEDDPGFENVVKAYEDAKD